MSDSEDPERKIEWSNRKLDEFLSVWAELTSQKKEITRQVSELSNIVLEGMLTLNRDTVEKLESEDHVYSVGLAKKKKNMQWNESTLMTIFMKLRNDPRFASLQSINLNDFILAMMAEKPNFTTENGDRLAIKAKAKNPKPRKKKTKKRKRESE